MIRCPKCVAVTKRETNAYLKAGVFDPFLNSPDMVKGSWMGSFQNWLKEQFRQAQVDGWALDPNFMPTMNIGEILIWESTNVLLLIPVVIALVMLVRWMRGRAVG